MKLWNDSTTSTKDYPDFEISDKTLRENKDLWVPVKDVYITGYYALMVEDSEEESGIYSSCYYWWYDAVNKTWHYNSEDQFIVNDIGYEFAYLVKE